MDGLTWKIIKRKLAIRTWTLGRSNNDHGSLIARNVRCLTSKMGLR